MTTDRPETLSRARPAIVPIAIVLAASSLLVGASTGGASCPADASEILDGLTGRWHLRGADGEILGTAVTERFGAACVVHEVWTEGSELVATATVFVEENGTWHLVWTDPDGGLLRFEGGVDGETIALRGHRFSADGLAEPARAILAVGTPGTRRFMAGYPGFPDATAATPFLEITYVQGDRDPRDVRETSGVSGSEAPPNTSTEPPSEAASPTPAEEPPPPPATEPPPPTRDSEGTDPAAVDREGAASEEEAPKSPVVAVSERADEQPDPEPTRMASPMTLEVEVGPVERLPAGYSWQTTETAPYLCGETSIPRVTVIPNRKRGQLRLDVVVTLHDPGFLRSVGLEVELIDGNETVASGADDDIGVGRSIPSTRGAEGLEKTFELELERDRFDALFADDERPRLRLTLTCE